MITKIPTRRSLICRMWRACERSWFPAIAFYAVIFAAIAAANWGNTL